MTTSDEIYYSIALTRMTGFNQQMALQLYQTLGSSKTVYDHRNDIGDVVPDATPRLREAMKNWDDALHRAAAEMEFVTKPLGIIFAISVIILIRSINPI